MSVIKRPDSPEIPFTESRLQLFFYRHKVSAYDMIVPNFTPIDWHECDIFAVTKAGYAQEYEIKISVSDFKADFKKRESEKVRVSFSSEKGRNVYTREKGELKHDRIKRVADGCPSAFSYIVPCDMIKVEDVPDYAGLIYAKKNNDGYIWLETQKQAKKLHKNKVDEKVIEQARGAFYYRMWGAKEKINGLDMDLFREKARGIDQCQTK